MINYFSFNDKINLYDLAEVISISKKYNTREKVTAAVFSPIKPVKDFDENYMYKYGTDVSKFLKKYLSSDNPRNNVMLDEISEAVSDICNSIRNNDLNRTQSSLIDSCIDLAKNLSAAESQEIISTLFNYCNFINFSEDEFELLESYYLDKNNSVTNNGTILAILYSHAIKNYKINLPKFYANRLFYEAMTLTYASDMQKFMFKEAADICRNMSQSSIASCESACNYANLMYSKDPELACDYFLTAASKLPSAWWEIGFLIETGKLSEKTVLFLDRKISNDFAEELSKIQVLKSNDIVNRAIPLAFRSKSFSDIIEENNLITCFKLYYAVSQKYYFSKAYNSVGKLLINNIVYVIDVDTGDFSESENYNLATDFLYKAMAMGNINAMVNMGEHLYQEYRREPNLPTHKYQRMCNLLSLAADTFSEPEACRILGDLYYSKNDFSLSYSYYEKAVNRDSILPNGGYCFFMLGEINYKMTKFHNAISMYQKAIGRGYYAAALSCSKTWYRIYLNLQTENSPTAISYARLALDNLNTYRNVFENLSDSVKQEAEFLSATLESVCHPKA